MQKNYVENEACNLFFLDTIFLGLISSPSPPPPFLSFDIGQELSLLFVTGHSAAIFNSVRRCGSDADMTTTTTAAVAVDCYVCWHSKENTCAVVH